MFGEVETGGCRDGPRGAIGVCRGVEGVVGVGTIGQGGDGRRGSGGRGGATGRTSGGGGRGRGRGGGGGLRGGEGLSSACCGGSGGYCGAASNGVSLSRLGRKECTNEEGTYPTDPAMSIPLSSSRILFPPTAPPTAAPTMMRAKISATTRNVRTFIPKMMRGGRLFGSRDDSLPTLY